MNAHVKFFIAGFASVLSLSGQNGQTSLDSALIACYPFTGNANDASGNNHNGTVNGAALTTDRFNNTNSAYYFSGNSGTTNIVVPGFSSELNSGAVSISFWTSKTSYETRSAFIMAPDDISNRLCVSVYYGNNINNSEVYWDCGNISGSGRMHYTYCPLPANGGWDHWVFVSSQSGNYMKAYQNGSLVYTKTSSSTFSAVTGRDLSIGGGYDVNNGYLWFEGKIDDIRIYNRILLPGEVSTLYNSTVICTSCPPVATPSNVTMVSSSCPGSSATLSAVGSPNINWYSSPTSTLSIGSGTSFITPTFTAAGTYSFYAIDSNTCALSQPLLIVYTVNPIPNIVATSGNTLVCLGKSTQLNASGGTSYTWMPGAQQSQSITVSPSSNTTYTLTGTNGYCTNSASVSISVALLPTISIVATPTVCIGTPVSFTAQGANNYTWSTGATTATMSLTPTVGGNKTYTVTGSDANTGCTNTATFTQFVSICVSLAEKQANSTVRVYPNPNDGRFTLTVDGESNVSVFNSLGALIYENRHSGTSEINLQQFSAGVYLMNVSAGGKSTFFRIVKQ